MIPTTYTGFFSLLLTIWMLHLTILWFREIQRVKRNEWHLTNRRLFHCNNCHHSFIPKQAVSLCRCPRCNTVCIIPQRNAMIDRNRPEEDKNK